MRYFLLRTTFNDTNQSKKTIENRTNIPQESISTCIDQEQIRIWNLQEEQIRQVSMVLILNERLYVIRDIDHTDHLSFRIIHLLKIKNQNGRSEKVRKI